MFTRKELAVIYPAYFKKEYENAPCYYHLPDDGAKMRCSDCGEYFNPTELIWTFTPDRKPPTVMCMDCVDEDWLNNAKDMGITER